MHDPIVAPAETALPPLRDVIARYGLAARKSLGQHFLLDANLTGRIARSANDLSAGTTIEVGPGPGGLTRALLAEGAGSIVAIERDARCFEALQDLAKWMAEGRLTTREHVLEGIECFPEAVKMLFAGENRGKLLIRL